MSDLPDLERFRLRRFVERLIDIGAVEIHDEPVALADLSRIIEASDKAVLFRAAGPGQQELVAGVIGARARLAAAMEVSEEEMVAELARRQDQDQPLIELPSAQAPVHQRVLTGGQIDLAALPFHLQHDCDGAPYISSAIDYSVDRESGRRNVGCRRLMFRNRTTMRSNLSQPSDLQRSYRAAVARGESLPVSFVIGSSPLDFLAAVMRTQGDELVQVARMRGAPLPVVRGVTNDILVPADAEMVIEGYFDELGYREQEGPYGEFWGYYGPVHIDPVFHVTAITQRRDMLHQSLLHGGRRLERMEIAPIAALHGELAAWRVLRAANIAPRAVRVVQHAAPRQHVRVSMTPTMKGQARLAISALFGLQGVKHVVIVDEDIDIDDDHEVEWAMSTRFRADRDLVVESGFSAYYADPTAEDRTVAKLGFDLTSRWHPPGALEERRPSPPAIARVRTHGSVAAALAERPMHFAELMSALGSDDGREVAIELDGLRESGRLSRLDDGRWKFCRTGDEQP
jgi:2,5-furandicarboxylate decarboxylase 1